MDENRLFNGVYIRGGKDESAATGFVPYSLQLFRLTPVVEKVIRAFPGLKTLADEFPGGKPVEIVQALVQKKILRPGPPPLPDMPPTPGHFSDIAFMLNDDEKHMSQSRLEQAIGFFLKQTGDTLFKSLTLFSDDPGLHLPLIRCAFSRVRRRASGNVRFILRVPDLPRSIEPLRLALKYKAVLHLDISPPEGESLHSHVREMVRPFRRPAFKPQRKLLSGLTRLARLHPLAGDIEEIPLSMDLFREIGIKRLYLDHLCRTCGADDSVRKKPVPVSDAGALANMAVKLSLNIESMTNHMGGFMDGTPVFHSLLSARRRFNGCAAGLSYCAVAPDGGIYPCLKTIGHKNYRLGDLDGGEINTNHHIRQTYLNRRPEKQENCAGCAAIYICGGAGPGGPNPGYCNFMMSLVDEILPLYGELDPMDKNLVLSETRKINRWLPHLKPLSTPPPPFSLPRQLTVRSDSMAPLFSNGDRVKTVPIDGQKIRVGDIVCHGQPVICHRVIARYRKRGVRYVIEKGDAIAGGRTMAEQEINGKVVALTRRGQEIILTNFPARLRNRWHALLSLARHLITVSRVKFNWKFQKNN